MEGVFAKSVKDLKVYTKAYTLAQRIHTLSLAFPKYEQYSLADSFVAAQGRFVPISLKDLVSSVSRKSFISIALGSVVESIVWNDFAYDFCYITNEQHSTISEELASIELMLHKLYKKIAT